MVLCAETHSAVPELYLGRWYLSIITLVIKTLRVSQQFGIVAPGVKHPSLAPCLSDSKQS